MPSRPRPLGLRKVRPKMPAAGLLTHQRRLRDQPRALDEVELFRRPLRKARLDSAKVLETGVESRFRAVDGGVLPHRAANVIGGNLGGPTVEQRGNVPDPDARNPLQSLRALKVSRHAFGEYQPLEK